MLLPQLHRKSKEVEPPPLLETPEQVQHSLERDYALGVRARRRQEENKAQAEEVEIQRAALNHSRERIYLGLELVGIAIFFVIAVALAVSDHAVLSLAVLGGAGSFGGLIGLLHKRGEKN